MRLIEAISEEEMLEYLPATVLIAWDELETGEHFRPTPGKPGTNFLSRVETLLSRLGSEAAEKLGWIAREPLEEQNLPSAEQFMAREEAQQRLHKLREKAGLSQRQDLVLELTLAGCMQSEISDRIDVSVRTVKRDFAEVRKKLKQAAEQ